ncbi:MAG: S41 family peptidase [Micromonosporaceae bacterium]|nr:S41 family peptidase [Micromonosporaceae bacterium]
MEQSAVTGIIGQIGDLVEKHYVFPEAGARVAGVLGDRAGEGRYTGIVDAQALAALVTEDLQSVNGDKHLRLQYSAEQIPDLTDEAAEFAAFTRMAADTMGGVSRVERLDGNIGYVDLSPVIYPPQLGGQAVTAAMSLVASTRALLLDVRRCLGGDPNTVALLLSYLFGEQPVHLLDMIDRDGRLEQRWTLPYVPGLRFGTEKPIYVLTSGTTFSGGEEVAYDLQQSKRAKVIGERTRGGAHPCERFRVHPQLRATIPVARSVHAISGTNWEGVGVAPDVEVPAEQAYDTAYGLASAALSG